jgi:integrase
LSVFKPTGTKTYTYSFQVNGRRFHGSTGKTEKRAAKEVERQAKEKARRQIEEEAKLAAQVDGSGPLTFDVAAGRYWNEVGQHHAGAETTFTDLNRLIEYFGKDRLLSKISDNDITQLVAWRRGHRFKDRAVMADGSPAPFIAPATVNRTTVDLLRKLYTRAKKKWGAAFPKEPEWKEHRLKERGEVVRELKVTEEDRFVEVLGDGYRDVWRFALASGLRLAECFIQWDQIDWDARTITVVQKGRRPHTIPLTNDMVAIIAPQRHRHPVWVFTYVCQRSSKKLGHAKGERYPVSYEGMKTAWRRKRGMAGAADMRFHDNRHTAATRLIRKTGNLKAAQKLLGHADITTTARFYAHVDMEDLRALLDATGRTHPQGNPQGLGAEAEADSKAKAKR